MRSSSKVRIIIFCVILSFIAILAFVLLSMRISDIEITGNNNYSNEQIEEMIFKKDIMKNPFVFYFNTKFGKQEKIPFVSKYDVKIKSLSSVKISVYEKKVVGYLKYFGNNMYFDKDGIVNESSEVVLEGIPRITGIDFDYIVLKKKIPVEDDKIFKEIMNVTQLLSKYEIAVDRIKINELGEMILYMGDVKVELGADEYVNEKIIDLHDLLPNLEGLSGTLDMIEYSEKSEGYTFKKN